MRNWMLGASGLLMALNLGFVLGDIAFSVWNDIFRDTLMTASNLIIFLTWKIFPK
jgi:hypothetical protein